MMNWTELRNEISDRCMARKESQQAAFELAHRYDGLSDEQKAAADEEMARWLESSDSTLRYDAAFVVSTCRVKPLLPAIERAIEALSGEDGPEAVYEAKKLRRIVDDLA